MAELTLRSSRQGQLKPLVEAAINNELRLLEAGMNRTRQRLKEFGIRFGLTSEEFIRRYGKGEMEESLEFAEWIGEYRLLDRFQEKVETLREIRLGN